MKNTILLFLSALLLSSCTSKIKTRLSDTRFAPLQVNSLILMTENQAEIPADSDFVGTLKIGDSGFTIDCDYEAVMAHTRVAAQQSGANLVLLTEVQPPNFGSTCYRVQAKLYRNLDENVIAEVLATRKDANASRLPADADYAMVYFYRPRNFAGSAVGYNVRTNDETVLGRARNGEKFEYKVTDFGEQTFRAKTEAESALTIDIQKGQEYFIQCTVKMGALLGRPELRLIENRQGIKEYEEL